MHLVNWDSITCPTNLGGHGVLDLADMNKTLAANGYIDMPIIKRHCGESWYVHRARGMGIAFCLR